MLSLMEMVRMCVSGSVLTREERDAIERLRERRKKAAQCARGDGMSFGVHDADEDNDAPIVSYRIPEVMMLRKGGHERGDGTSAGDSAGSSNGSSYLKRMLTGVGRKVRGGPGGGGWRSKSRANSLESESSVDTGKSFVGRTESDEYFLRCFEEG